jgi:hypothetical protein
MAEPIKEKPKWKKFEEFVASIQKDLSPDAKVVHDEKILGKSGIMRQIDIAIRQSVGQFSLLMIIDCKDWKKPVDINDVAAFIDMVEDVEANKGAIVCNAEFTAGAKGRAKEKGIDLLLAIDTESIDWPHYLALPTVCESRYMKNLQFCFKHCAPTPFRMSAGDPKFLNIYKKDGSLIGILGNLLIKAWDEGKLAEEVGYYKDVSFIDEDCYTKVKDVLYGPVQITVIFCVDRKLHFGAVPIEKSQGFGDAISGTYTTRSMQFGIDVTEIEAKWKKIDSEDDLAVKPSFRFVAFDCLALLSEE